MYVIIVASSIGGIGGPSLQAIITQNVPATEQGAWLFHIAGCTGETAWRGVSGRFVAGRAWRLECRAHAASSPDTS